MRIFIVYYMSENEIKANGECLAKEKGQEKMLVKFESHGKSEVKVEGQDKNEVKI